MCNLSELLVEKGDYNRTKITVLNLYKRGFSIKEISEIVQVDIKTIQDILTPIAV